MTLYSSDEISMSFLIVTSCDQIGKNGQGSLKTFLKGEEGSSRTEVMV